MSARLLTPPAVEPWTVGEAKEFLRVATDDDDAIIASLIASARGQVEAQARCLLISQTWRIARNAWPADGRLSLRFAPLRAVIAARVFNTAGLATSIDPESFVIDGAGVVSAPPWSLPPPGRAVAGIELDIEAGFGASPEDVPELLRHAVRILVAHGYDNRGLVAIGGTVAMLPGSVNAMIASYRALSL